MSSSNVSRVKDLEKIESNVIEILQTAGKVLLEIVKEEPNDTVVNDTRTIMQKINYVENNLLDHVRYLTQVSTGHPHEGSSYPSQKVLQTAWHRLEHAKSRISELDNHRNRIGADLARNSSSTVQKQGASGCQQGSGSLKQ